MSKLSRRDDDASGEQPKSTDVDLTSVADGIKETIEQQEVLSLLTKPVAWDEACVVSTGSTWLDLTISGGRTYYGGIPCCTLAEVHGPSGSGKTSILASVGANIQMLGGDTRTHDPESRMDEEYNRIYGFEMDKKNYFRPSTVSEVFEDLYGWNSKVKPRALLTDSLAALTTDLEMETGDKMGMRRAKEFSAGLRKYARTISDMLWLASNQERVGDGGIPTTPGGEGIGYYASLRIRVKQVDKIITKKKNIFFNGDDGEEKKDDKKKKKAEPEIERPTGIVSECSVTKSTLDVPYRKCKIYIVFNYGIDDIRSNLQYLKDIKGLTSYLCPDGKKYLGLDQAIIHIEENELEKPLREEMVMVWHEIEQLFANKRKRKERF